MTCREQSKINHSAVPLANHTPSIRQLAVPLLMGTSTSFLLSQSCFTVTDIAPETSAKDTATKFLVAVFWHSGQILNLLYSLIFH